MNRQNRGAQEKQQQELEVQWRVARLTLLDHILKVVGRWVLGYLRLKRG